MNQKPKRDLKEACIIEAYRIIEEHGTASLSLRDVARRLGVSHQAPYRHFASRDHVMAEIISRIFAGFAAYLKTGLSAIEASVALRQMGERYLDYAARYPLKYQLMFNTPLPPSGKHPEMMAQAQSAFKLLHYAIERLPQKPGATLAIKPFEDAMFVWSALHGLASILQSDAAKTLQMTDQDKTAAIARIFERIGLALGDV